MFPAYFNVTLEELKHLILNIAADFFLNFPFFLRKMKSEETVSVGQKTKQNKKKPNAGRETVGRVNLLFFL